MRRLPWLLTILALLLLTVPASAAYLFEVPKNVSYVTVNKDGSVEIEYRITFKCLAGGQAIDVVDIGLPNRNYSPQSFTASIDGHPLTDIRQSEYISIGVEVHLGSWSIKPGQSKTLRVKGRVDRMIWEDDDNGSYASVEFKPTWFDSSLTRGTTALTINMNFPAGVTANETKYHEIKPTDMMAKKGHMVFRWHWADHSPSSSEQVGIGFPKTYVDKVYKQTFGEKLAIFFGAVAGCIGMIIFPWVFPFGFIFFLVYWSHKAKKRRMMKYLPPELSVEGVGVKRGMTAPEAAIINEVPLDRVLIMVLFGLVRKGAVKILDDKPLTLQPYGLPEGQKLRPYETDFLKAVDKKGRLDKAEIKSMLIKMIKATNKKLKGFSRQDTAIYYKRIVVDAWGMVEKASTPDVVKNSFDERLEWLMMDTDFDRRVKTGIPVDTVFIPDWWVRGGVYRGPSTVGSGSGGAMPSFSVADFANNVTNSISNFASGVVTDVSNFTSSITNTTNPPPVSSSSGWSGGSGGSGCACACACAGCACACAGGGR